MKLEITALEKLPQGSGVRIKVGDQRIAMFRVGDEVFALDDVCSHAEASLAEGEVWDGSVECPRHGSNFDLKTGEPGALPATVAVSTYEVTVEDGTVFLTLEEK